MRILREKTDIPVPPIRWYEADSSLLGAPFFVMDRIAGQVPTDMPPYHTGGWVTEIEPAEREAIWWNALEIVARLHRLDAAALDVDFVDQPQFMIPCDTLDQSWSLMPLRIRESTTACTVRPLLSCFTMPTLARGEKISIILCSSAAVRSERT